jgi:hypothetical protein
MRRLKDGNVDSKITADLAAGETAAQVSDANAILQYRIAEIGHWYEPDKLIGYSTWSCRSISPRADLRTSHASSGDDRSGSSGGGRNA